MTWLERRFPQLFSNGSALLDIDHEGASYVVRHYPGSDIYIAVSDGTLYALGAFTGHQVQAFGPAWLVSCTIDGVNCPANVAVDPVVAKPRNACAPSTSPKPGDLSVAIYRYSGDVSGRVTFTSEVGAATLLQGQTVLPIEVTTEGSLSNGLQTVAVQDWVISYERSDAKGTTWRLGQLQESTTTSATGARVTTTTQHVYNPALPDSEFTMQPGDYLVKSSSRTSTQIEPIAVPAKTSPYTETFSFRALETITVLGRSYETCRYDTDGSWTRWLQVGTGKLVRQSRAQSRSQSAALIELEP